MKELIESLITQFKKQRIIRGNIWDNFIFFCYKALGADKDDKYKHTRASILKYMTQNKNEILLKLTRN
jgi:hypothetical protein|tara:strand:+ start:1553 stop:1756 length:204 start_codon:yes stop_codon:yes gene_type:complete